MRQPNEWNCVFLETGLLKSWPESGPGLLWSREDLDRGSPQWTQPVIHDGVLYIRHGEAIMSDQSDKDIL